MEFTRLPLNGLKTDAMSNKYFSYVGNTRSTDYELATVFPPVLKKSGASSHGWIKNCDTGVIKQFQFNPAPPFQYSRGATYSTIESPGQQYPLTSFVKGNLRTFNLDLLLFDKPYTGLIDKDYMLFFGGLLTPEANSSSYTRPPKFILSYGYFVRTCVLEDLSISIEEYDRFLRPVKAVVGLTIRQEGV